MTYYCVETTCTDDGVTNAVMKEKFDGVKKPTSCYRRVGNKDIYTDWLCRDGAAAIVKGV